MWSRTSSSARSSGYRGWRWAVTVARASRAKIVTLDEAVLLPGPDALLAPEWVPWSERLRPGDMGPGDLLPTDAEDLRLEPGYAGEDEPLPNSAVSEEMAELAEAEDADVTAGAPASCRRPVAGHDRRGRRGAGHAPRPGAVPLRAAHRRRPLGGGVRPKTPDGPGGPRVLRELRLPPADRRLAGPGLRRLRQRVRARPTAGWSRLAYGCGGHSEAAVMPRPPRPAPPVIDETRVDPFPLRPAADSGSVSDGRGRTRTAVVDASGRTSPAAACGPSSTPAGRAEPAAGAAGN